ncbi:MAG: hypothetical protein ACJAZS_000611 [Alteromonas naphthalenivorans]|jgi:hypothetical protein
MEVIMNKKLLSLLLVLGTVASPTWTANAAAALALEEEIYTEDQIIACSVCHDPVLEDAANPYRVTHCCRNIFHDSCLTESLRHNPICPLCRSNNPNQPAVTNGNNNARITQLRAERDNAIQTRATFRTERDAARTERDATRATFRQERERIESNRDRAIRDRDEITRERDNVRTEATTLRNERDFARGNMTDLMLKRGGAAIVTAGSVAFFNQPFFPKVLAASLIGGALYKIEKSRNPIHIKDAYREGILMGSVIGGLYWLTHPCK